MRKSNTEERTELWTKVETETVNIRSDRMNNNERLYKTMRNSGAGAVAMGIVIATVGLTVGTISIIMGAFLLKRKSEIEF